MPDTILVAVRGLTGRLWVTWPSGMNHMTTPGAGEGGGGHLLRIREQKGTWTQSRHKTREGMEAGKRI